MDNGEGETTNFFIKGTGTGLWYEVISSKDDPSSGKVLARFEIGYNDKLRKFVLKRILFDKNTPKELWGAIMSYVRDFVNSINE